MKHNLIIRFGMIKIKNSDLITILCMFFRQTFCFTHSVRECMHYFWFWKRLKKFNILEEIRFIQILSIFNLSCRRRCRESGWKRKCQQFTCSRTAPRKPRKHPISTRASPQQEIEVHHTKSKKTTQKEGKNHPRSSIKRSK